MRNDVAKYVQLFIEILKQTRKIPRYQQQI